MTAHRHPNCPGEECQISANSNGPVDDQETLGRRIFSPEHTNNDGTIKPTAFKISDIAKRGLSLTRVHQTTYKDELNRYEHMAQRCPNQRVTYLMATAKCDTLRSVKTNEGDRWLCVFDSGTSDNPAHAQATAPNHFSEPYLRGLRNQLIDAFNSPRYISDIW